VLKKFIAAVYPDRAKAEGIEGTVVLDIDIDPKGGVESVSVVAPSDHPGYGLEDAALAAVAQFEFEPAEAEGKPIPVRITYRYRFALTAAPASTAKTGAPRPSVVNFEGRLVERGTRAPLAGLRVTIFRDGAGFEASSDAAGRFQLFDLAPGEWKILVEADGYFPLRTSETIAEGERLEVTYHLERHSYNPYDVLVEAQRPRKEVTRRTVSVTEIEKVPGTFGDPLAVVSNLPSVARPPFGLGLLVVRGSSPEDTRVAVESLDVPTVYHFFALRSVLPTGMISSLDFYPGNFSTYYGRAIGGILDVKLKELAPLRVGGYLDVSILDTSAYLQAPIGKDGAIALGLRRSYIDVLLKAAIPADSGVSFTTAPRYYDWQLLGNYRPSPSQRLALFFFGSDDSMREVVKNAADIDPNMRSGRFSLYSRFYRGTVVHNFTPSESVDNELRVAGGFDKSHQSIGDQSRLDEEVSSLQVRDRLRLALAKTLALSIGVDVGIARVKADVRTQGGKPSKEGDAPTAGVTDEVLSTKIDGQWVHEPAGYIEAEWRPVPALLVAPGLRVDYFGQVHELTVEPRLTLRYAVNSVLTAKAAVGLFHQEPTYDELDKGYGNPKLGTERALHYALGTELRPFEHLGIDITGFYKPMDHMVARSDRLVERDGALVPERFSNEGRGRVYGADILIRQELWHDFFGWVAYTLSRSERRDPGSSSYRLFDFDQTHILTAVASYRLPRNWEIGLRWRYVTGSAMTPIKGGVFASDSDTYFPVSGRVNSARLGAFHQLDVRVDKRWIYDGWMFNAYIDLQNAYSRTNPEFTNYNYDFSKQKVGGGFPILPIVGLRAEL
jgi:TonB family protein